MKQKLNTLCPSLEISKHQIPAYNKNFIPRNIQYSQKNQSCHMNDTVESPHALNIRKQTAYNFKARMM